MDSLSGVEKLELIKPTLLAIASFGSNLLFWKHMADS